jgi:hypothetical protein
MYAKYCANHTVAAELALKLEKAHSARLRAFFSRAYAQTNRLSLRDYLIKPVQRICKYPLLLRVRSISFSVLLMMMMLTLSFPPSRS